MDIKAVENLIALAKKEGVKTLKYEQKEMKIEISFCDFSLQQQSAATQNPPPNPSLGLGLHRHQYQDQASGGKAGVGLHTPQEDKNIKKVTSPFVGTFYTSPSPQDPAYARVGDKVRKGQTLCIVEAMKIMNEIESDVNGEIIEICVENESLVEYGQVLFLIKVV